MKTKQELNEERLDARDRHPCTGASSDWRAEERRKHLRLVKDREPANFRQLDIDEIVEASRVDLPWVVYHDFFPDGCQYVGVTRQDVRHRHRHGYYRHPHLQNHHRLTKGLMTIIWPYNSEQEALGVESAMIAALLDRGDVSLLNLDQVPDWRQVDCDGSWIPESDYDPAVWAIAYTCWLNHEVFGGIYTTN